MPKIAIALSEGNYDPIMAFKPILGAIIYHKCLFLTSIKGGSKPNCIKFRINMLRGFSIIFTIILFAQIGLAQTGAVKYSNEYLSIGVDARALAMSNAAVASTNSAYSVFWNPAGMASMNNNLEVGLMHAEYFAGIAKYDFGAFAAPLKSENAWGRHAIGLGVMRFGVDDIPNTILLYDPDGSINYDNISTFSVADYALLLSYASQLPTEGLTAGVTAKVIHRRAGAFGRAWGFGFDLGANYQIGNWRLSAMGKDLTSTFNVWSYSFSAEERRALTSSGNAIPETTFEVTLPKVLLAAAYSTSLNDKLDLIWELDLDFTTDGKRNVLISANPISIDPHTGAELSFKKFVFLRAGLGNIQKATLLQSRVSEKWTVQPNAGVGLKLRNINIDYAYTDIGDQSAGLYSHVFSLKLNLNREKATQ